MRTMADRLAKARSSCFRQEFSRHGALVRKPDLAFLDRRFAIVSLDRCGAVLASPDSHSSRGLR
jgi:hypothetical protein